MKSFPTNQYYCILAITIACTTFRTIILKLKRLSERIKIKPIRNFCLSFVSAYKSVVNKDTTRCIAKV